MQGHVPGIPHPSCLCSPPDGLRGKCSDLAHLCFPTEEAEAQAIQLRRCWGQGSSLGRLRLPPPGPVVFPGRHSRLGGENGVTLDHGVGCGGCSNFLLEYRCQSPLDVPLPSLALSRGATESVLSWPGKLSTEESLAQPSGCWGSSQETLSRGWAFHP